MSEMVFNEFCSFCGSTTEGYQVDDFVFICNHCLAKKLEGIHTKTCQACRTQVKNHRMFIQGKERLCEACIQKYHPYSPLEELEELYAPTCSKCKNHTAHYGTLYVEGECVCIHCVARTTNLLEVINKELDPMQLTLSY